CDGLARLRLEDAEHGTDVVGYGLRVACCAPRDHGQDVPLDLLQIHACARGVHAAAAVRVMSARRASSSPTRSRASSSSIWSMRHWRARSRKVAALMSLPRAHSALATLSRKSGPLRLVRVSMGYSCSSSNWWKS